MIAIRSQRMLIKTRQIKTLKDKLIMVNQMKTHNYLLFRNALSKIADPDVNNWKHVKSIKPTQIILNKDRL